MRQSSPFSMVQLRPLVLGRRTRSRMLPCFGFAPQGDIYAAIFLAPRWLNCGFAEGGVAGKSQNVNSRINQEFSEPGARQPTPFAEWRRQRAVSWKDVESQ
jgi:hypothetical protein